MSFWPLSCVTWREKIGFRELIPTAEVGPYSRICTSLWTPRRFRCTWRQSAVTYSKTNKPRTRLKATTPVQPYMKEYAKTLLSHKACSHIPLKQEHLPKKEKLPVWISFERFWYLPKSVFGNCGIRMRSNPDHSDLNEGDQIPKMIHIMGQRCLERKQLHHMTNSMPTFFVMSGAWLRTWYVPLCHMWESEWSSFRYFHKKDISTPALGDRKRWQIGGKKMNSRHTSKKKINK